MKRVHVLVEGQTEETFVRQLLAPHLSPLGIHLIPTLLITKRVKTGPSFRGGVTSYAKVRRHLKRLLGDSNVAVVTTMIDFYGLPKDFPGLAAARQRPASKRAKHLEEALQRDLLDRRLIPYFSLHEFEALLFVAPEEIERALTQRGLGRRLAHPAAPEEINDGEETHPAARIRALAPRYRKALHGPIIAERIGLVALRQSCPHFDAWVERLETVSE